MKFLFFLVAGLALAQATVLPTITHRDTVVDSKFLIKQYRVFFLMNHVTRMTKISNMKTLPEFTGNTLEDKFMTEYINILKNWNFVDHVDSFVKPEVIDKYVSFMRYGLTPFTTTFTLTCNKQREEAMALFNLFFYAKDFETFFRTACWAREYVNMGLFVYTFNVAIMHRKDCLGLITPPMYEVYPFDFVGADVLHRATAIEHMGIKNFMNTKNTENRVTYNDNSIFIEDHFSRNFDVNDLEMKMKYFTHDVTLSTYYTFFNMDYPFWMTRKELGLYKDRRGELNFYVHQQLLARYYMERLSNGLGVIPRFSWTKPIKQGFNPNMLTAFGTPVSGREYNYDLDTEANVYHLQTIFDFERRIRDAIYKGGITLYDGTTLTFTKAEDFDTLVRFIFGNKDIGDYRYTDHLTVVAKMVLGGATMTYDNFKYVPSVLDNTHTCLRDPMFYMFTQRLVHYCHLFKNMLPSYTKHELNFDGVIVRDVKVSPLFTYFEKFYFDITNAISLTYEKVMTGKTNIKYYSVQKRLNHKTFTIDIDVASTTSTDATVRIFLGPKYDTFGRLLDINDNKHNFVEIDTFLTTLKTGNNLITRRNTDFTQFTRDFVDTRTLFDTLTNSILGGHEFKYDTTVRHNLFPLHLALPKGTVGGMTFQLYVIVTPYRAAKTTYGTGYSTAFGTGVGTGGRYLEDIPLGFPFDRFINRGEFFTKNMYMTDVKITHIKTDTTTGDFWKSTGFNTRDFTKDFTNTRNFFTTGDFTKNNDFTTRDFTNTRKFFTTGDDMRNTDFTTRDFTKDFTNTHNLFTTDDKTKNTFFNTRDFTKDFTNTRNFMDTRDTHDYLNNDYTTFHGMLNTVDLRPSKGVTPRHLLKTTDFLTTKDFTPREYTKTIGDKRTNDYFIRDYHTTNDWKTSNGFNTPDTTYSTNTFYNRY